MPKRVFIIHGWGGNPNEAWFPWLKRELEARGFRVEVPAMPGTEEPKIETWVPHLARIVDRVDAKTYFIGHSIGCQTILRYLDGADEGARAGGAVLVAGFIKVTGLATEEEPIVKPWLETPIRWEKVKKRSRHFIAIHSDNDPYVPFENAEFFREKLGAEVVMEHHKGHFGAEDGITEFPLVLEKILKLAQS